MTKVAVIGGSGYVGGELLRILLTHPSCEVRTITSQKYAGQPLYRAHPNLRGVTDLKFSDPKSELTDAEFVFTALPHGRSVEIVPTLLENGMRVVDLSADFRLKNSQAYDLYYNFRHPHPELLDKAAYGLPEFHEKEIRAAQLIAVPGCMATSAILGLAPLLSTGMIHSDRIVVDAKIGSSGAGASSSIGSHHSERSEGVRAYQISGHRHIAEIEQELNAFDGGEVNVSFTPHAVDMVRGILSTAHTFAKNHVEKVDVWKAYRSHYADKPFIRMVSDNKGLYGLPNPKTVVGTNFCDIGFEIDGHAQRIVVLTAIDNLMKGAAGQAIQCFNLATGTDERAGLGTVALHP